MTEYEAKLASSPEGELADYLLEFPVYHGRVDDLEREDFLPHKGSERWANWKGFAANFTQGVATSVNASSVAERAEIAPKTLEYLQKIVNLCREDGVELVLFSAPEPLTTEQQAIYNSVADFAVEQGLTYINYNLEVGQVGIDYSTDFASDGHLNYKGAEKLTSYLGSWIASSYDLPDRRGEAGYESWQADADDIRARRANAEVQEAGTGLADCLGTVLGEGYTTVVVMGESAGSVSGYVELNSALDACGLAPAGDGAQVVVVDDGEVVWQTSDVSFDWHADLGDTVLRVSCEGDGSSIVVERPYSSVSPSGSGVLVYSWCKTTGQAVGPLEW